MSHTPSPAAADTAAARPAAYALTHGGRRWHRPLVALAAAGGAVALFSLAAMPFDDRTLLGESVWSKPFKFGFAFFAYALSLAWLLSHLTRLRRTGWVVGTGFAVVGLVDFAVVVAAAAAGTFSHFNGADTPLNQLVQFAFDFVPVLFLTSAAIGVIVLFQRVGDRAVTAVVRWGLALASLGMLAAIFILAVADQPDRTQVDANGDQVPLSGGHGVGDPDGSGMFLTGWSTTGGDLRVSHFIGLHGIQVLIGLAMLLSLLAAGRAWLRDDRVRAGIVRWFALGYSGVFVTTVWQAARGQAFTAPDAATLAAFAASVLVAVLGIAVTVARARSAARV
ncbi:hypothetical protein [Glycomyces terrestris]|uniref:Uncharacterized protein n=1 Tax=Glycomyces terrestris TaxID=2493553 RepID=A0A426V3T8_9ACTN|nr:hypothetical protein [Glycomyces terrestris]RRS01536.1 hypothetical protein EIW28_01845 [Glycomyces terrestris]